MPRPAPLTDSSATAGRNFTLFGKNLTVVGNEPSMGIILTSVSTRAVTKLDKDINVLNELSRLIILLPANLDDGEYTLTVTTQYKGSSTELLKKPRSTSQIIYIGNALSSRRGNQGGNDGNLEENPLG